MVARLTRRCVQLEYSTSRGKYAKAVEWLCESLEFAEALRVARLLSNVENDTSSVASVEEVHSSVQSSSSDSSVVDSTDSSSESGSEDGSDLRDVRFIECGAIVRLFIHFVDLVPTQNIERAAGLAYHSLLTDMETFRAEQRTALSGIIRCRLHVAGMARLARAVDGDDGDGSGAGSHMDDASSVWTDARCVLLGFPATLLYVWVGFNRIQTCAHCCLRASSIAWSLASSSSTQSSASIDSLSHSLGA